MRRFLITLSLLVAATAPAIKALAQDPVPLSLDECMNYAMKHNYAVKNSRLDVEIQRAQNAQTTALALPQINGKAEFDDNINPAQTFFPVGAFGQILGSFIGPQVTPLVTPLYQQFPNLTQPTIQSTGDGGGYEAIQFSPKYASSVGLSGSQTLFDGSVLVALQARNTVMELARQNSEVTKETVRYNVFKAYHSLAIAYRQYDIIKSSLNYARQLEHDIMVTQQNGLAEKIEVERTSVQVNNLATDSIRIGSLLSVSEQALKYVMGMDISTPIVLTDTAVEERRNEVISLLSEESNYARVPLFNLYQTQLMANEYNVKRYKLAALPTISMFGNVGYNFASNDISPLFNSQYIFSSIIGVQLSVPIFDGLLRVNHLREARLNVEKAQNNIDNEKLTIDFNTDQSRTILQNSVLQAESQHRNLELANDVLDLANKKYKAGVGSNQEVSQAQTDHLTAQTNYFNALMDLINAEADLKKALGLLNNN